jgi:hypothetical protein
MRSYQLFFTVSLWLFIVGHIILGTYQNMSKIIVYMHCVFALLHSLLVAIAFTKKYPQFAIYAAVLATVRLTLGIL